MMLRKASLLIFTLLLSMGSAHAAAASYACFNVFLAKNKTATRFKAEENFLRGDVAEATAAIIKAKFKSLVSELETNGYTYALRLSPNNDVFFEVLSGPTRLAKIAAAIRENYDYRLLIDPTMREDVGAYVLTDGSLVVRPSLIKNLSPGDLGLLVHEAAHMKVNTDSRLPHKSQALDIEFYSEGKPLTAAPYADFYRLDEVRSYYKQARVARSLYPRYSKWNYRRWIYFAEYGEQLRSADRFADLAETHLKLVLQTLQSSPLRTEIVDGVRRVSISPDLSVSFPREIPHAIIRASAIEELRLTLIAKVKLSLTNVEQLKKQIDALVD